MSAPALKSRTPDETRALGERLGRLLRAGDAVLLAGELGAGKTTFVQGVAHGMGFPGAVSSKSFVLLGEYEGDAKLYHADLYRLEYPLQVEELGLDDVCADGALVVEWPERADGMLPPEHLWIEFRITGEAEFQRLKARLEEEGLFDPARKRSLPVFPLRIGVATSPTGAVFHDICHVLQRRWPLAEVILAPTPVQGPFAAPAIAAAISRLNAIGGIEVIIAGRGGGSIEELWPFNEEAVARAIFASAVPVVSAVGHETDFTIADFVADVRAPTPSAAAETVAPDWRQVSRHIENRATILASAMRGKLGRRSIEADRAGHRLRAALPDTSRYRERITSHLRHAAAAVSRGIGQRSAGAASFAAQLRALDPRATLARGYSVVQLRDGKEAITSVHQVKGRDRLDVHVKDGHFPAEVSRQYGF